MDRYLVIFKSCNLKEPINSRISPPVLEKSRTIKGVTKLSKKTCTRPSPSPEKYDVGEYELNEESRPTLNKISQGNGHTFIYLFLYE